MSDEVEGLKFDHDKPRWDLVPFNSMIEVVDILTMGAQKYAPDNWKRVSQPRSRYFAAALRHLVAWKIGEKIDPESGKSHLAHTICNLLFLIHFDQQEEHEQK